MSVPLCKDCKHFERTMRGPRCYRTAKSYRDRVTGEERTSAARIAETEREGFWIISYGCGPRGRYFEPKEATRQATIEQAADEEQPPRIQPEREAPEVGCIKRCYIIIGIAAAIVITIIAGVNVYG